jgi:arylsulfatase A-like enzyme
LITCDPNQADFKVPDIALPVHVTPERFEQRRALRELMNGRFQEPASGPIQRWSNWQSKAIDLLRDAGTQQAFEVERESDQVRDRYGRNRFGQSVLLARRLVESGVSLVQVNWTRWPEDENVAPAWDTHAKNSERLKQALMPPMDQAYSALLEDLQSRGMLDDTLVVWIGEFGRSPKINAAGGRDHWGHVFSAALAGGGVQGGAVYGESDSQGGYPLSGRVEPQDLTATIFHCLGYAPETEIHDRLGRPLAISNGHPIRQIL